MYHGYPEVPLAPRDVAINEKFHEDDEDDEDSCAQLIELPPVQSVRISFSALCYLGSLAQNASCHYAVLGRLCGVQLNETVEITNILPAAPTTRGPEDETPEMRERRIAAEQCEEKQMYERMGRMLQKEELDSYHVGQFTVCSACANAPFSVRTAQQLAQLSLDGHPSVLLVYDPFRTALMGKMYLRAFVPTQEYIDFYTKFSNKRNTVRENRLVRDCHVAKYGVLREVKIEMDVDHYQVLCLDSITVKPLPSTCAALNSDTMADYTAALLESTQRNCDELSRVLGTESFFSQKEENYGPLAQRIDTLLKLMQLRELTRHLESLSDGVLINAALLRDL